MISITKEGYSKQYLKSVILNRVTTCREAVIRTMKRKKMLTWELKDNSSQKAKYISETDKWKNASARRFVK